mmetsp:Transcript_35851/g.94101  ORF Transcript_35851/g.94101 Transcript_35851/m.94101 type:complete len:88 (-) Transcript_35851:673-936(-)
MGRKEIRITEISSNVHVDGMLSQAGNKITFGRHCFDVAVGRWREFGICYFADLLPLFFREKSTQTSGFSHRPSAAGWMMKQGAQAAQ